jgi:hypothetical protein
MNISDLTKMQQEPVSVKKRSPPENNNMEKQQKYLQNSQPDLPINVKRKSDSLGEANFMFVTTYHHIIAS